MHIQHDEYTNRLPACMGILYYTGNRIKIDFKYVKKYIVPTT